MVEPDLPKVVTRVRFPSPAPYCDVKSLIFKGFFIMAIVFLGTTIHVFVVFLYQTGKATSIIKGS